MNPKKLTKSNATQVKKKPGEVHAIRMPEAVKFPPLPPWIEMLIIVVFAIGLYANTLTHGFALDDTMMITHNQFTKAGIKGIGKILTNDAFTGFHGEDKNLLPGGRYRPLSQIMFAVEYEIFGKNPLPGHLINILLYAVACMLLYKMLRILFENERIQLWRLSLPFIITLLFTVHPLHTEVVANIKSRDEILGLIGFALLGLLALNYIKSQKRILYVSIVVVFLLSMLSKESALTYLAAVPLMILYHQGRFSKHMWHIFAVLVAGFVAYLIVRIGAIGVPPGSVRNMELLNNPFLHATAAEKLATLLFTWIKYVGLVLFPHPLTHDYYPWHITYKSFANGAVLLSLVFFAGFAIYSVKKIRKPDMVAMGFLLFVILFSSQSNLLVNIGAFMNERFVFVALLGVILMFVWFLLKWLPAKLKDNGSVALIIFAVMITGFSVKTVSRNKAWKDDFTLFTTDVLVSANSAKVNTSAGGAWYDKALATDNEEMRKGLLQKAVVHFENGVRLHPTYLDGQLALGNAYLYLEDYPKALEAYQACLRISHKYPKTFQNLKVLAAKALRAKDYPVSAAAYRILVDDDPADFGLRIDYAEALLNNREFGTSGRLLDSLLILIPKDARVNHLQGQLWGRYLAFEPGVTQIQRQQYLLRSKDYLIQAVGNDPDNYGMTENLGIVYGLLGDINKALSLFKKALDMMLAKKEEMSEDASLLKAYHEDLSRIYRNIGDTYRNMSDMRQAMEHYDRSIFYNSDDPALITQVASMYNSMGNRQKAVELLQAYSIRHPGERMITEMLEKLQ